MEVNTAPLEVLLRVPGIGPRGARLIVKARRTTCLREQELRKLGIAFKRARYFITCNGKYQGRGVEFSPEALRAQLASPIDGGKHGARSGKVLPGQLSLFDEGVGRAPIGRGDNGGAAASKLKAPMCESGAGWNSVSQRSQTPSGLGGKRLDAGQSVAAVADGIFGWQNAMQGREKVPA